MLEVLGAVVEKVRAHAHAHTTETSDHYAIQRGQGKKNLKIISYFCRKADQKSHVWRMKTIEFDGNLAKHHILFVGKRANFDGQITKYS